MTSARCEVIPGPGSVARRRDSLLWASEATPESVWDTLVACLGLGSRATASAAVLHGLAQTMLPGLGEGVAFAVLVSDGTAGFVLRHGAVDVLVDGAPVDEGELRPLTPGGAILVGDPGVVGAAQGQAPAYRHDLDGGAVPGGGLRWTATPRADVPSPAAPPDVAPAAPSEFVAGPPSQPMAAPPTQAEPTSDPEATEFHPPPHTDQAAEQVTDHVVRPAPGVLVFEDGATITLSGDVVLGRRPETHELVTGGQAQPVVIHDPDHVLSGAHAAIRFHGDEVVVLDLDSLNGTHVASPEAREWTRLTPGAPFHMQDGFRLLLGWTVLTYRR